MQISAKKLSKKNHQKILTSFATLLADIKDPRQTHEFFSHFMSQTEQLVFAKRLQILWLLHRGEPYQNIAENLSVSTATIASTSKLLENEKIKPILKKLELENWAQDKLKNPVLSKILGL